MISKGLRVLEEKMEKDKELAQRILAVEEALTKGKKKNNSQLVKPHYDDPITPGLEIGGPRKWAEETLIRAKKRSIAI